MIDINERERALMEGNLLEYPVFSMQKGRSTRPSEQYIWLEKDMAGNVLIERRLTVNCVEGVPNFFDMDVFNGVMKIYVRTRDIYKQNEIHFTIYELIKELELPIHDGSLAERVMKSLKRMANTTLNFENAFYIEKEKFTKIVHLIANVETYEKQKGKRLINMIKVVLDDELVNSIDKKYFKLIDFEVYKSLTSGLPRRLYEYLEKKKFRKSQFEIAINKLSKWMGLKTSQSSKLKGLFTKANNELRDKGVINQWEYHGSNLLYHFHKSEQFKEVEEDLFYLENLVVTFYESLGQKKIPAGLKREGMVILQDLLDEGYTQEEVKYALGWAVDNIKDIHSIRILPKVIGQALGAQESQRLVQEKESQKQQERLEQSKQAVQERQKAEELDQLFSQLPQQEKERLEGRAHASLLDQGIQPPFILPTLLRIERNRILEEEVSQERILK